MIDPTFGNINRLLVLSFKSGDNDPTRHSIDKYFISLADIKDFDTFIDNKPFFDQPIKTSKKCMRNLLNCMTIQQETY